MRLKKGDIIFLDLEDELNSYNSDFLEYYNSVKGIFTVYRDKEDFEENFLVHDFKRKSYWDCSIHSIKIIKNYELPEELFKI